MEGEAFEALIYVVAFSLDFLPSQHHTHTDMSTIELKNNLLRMVADTNDPVQLSLMVEWFGIVREEKDWWLEISERERQTILEARKQMASGRGIRHEEVRLKVQQLFQELKKSAKASS